MDAGYFVSPVLTADARHFVGETTFSALASEPARSSLYGDPALVSPHTHLAQNADLIIVAPATAHALARLAMGLANDLLTATVLATRAPVLLCPAMHTEMWEQPVVQEHLATLRRRGFLILEPASGHLAGGDEGVGRLREPEEIVHHARAILDGYRGPLTGCQVLISAGGTSEAIDPVRYISNRSTGHQGYALAEVAARLGATVTLVSAAPRELALDVRRQVHVVHVESAAAMADAVLSAATTADCVIMAAAVADFTVQAAANKIKKTDGVPVIELQPTLDIVEALLSRKTSGQFLVAFAAETTNVLEQAKAKLARKPVDLLVLNDVTQPGVGFASPTNAVTLLYPTGEQETIALASKEAIAQEILTRVYSTFAQGAQ
jgi:phosphopantothenoylcysteine decarboxylase/phosphopantothenate--cysteine ligase